MQPTELDANLRRAFERWNRGDYSVHEHEVDPNIEIVSAFGGIEERTYRGHDGLRRWVQDVTEAFDEWTSTSTRSSTWRLTARWSWERSISAAAGAVSPSTSPAPG